MLEFKVVLAIIATIIGIISYTLYYRGIFGGKTKPHAFSWFVWALLSGIAFAAQLAKNAGPGAWVTGFTALVCLSIAIVAIFKGKHHFPFSDWFCLISSFIAIGLWRYTSDPTASIILITITDVIAFIPTLRKDYYTPSQETISTFALNALKWSFALFALDNFALANWLYIVAMIVMNCILVTMVLLRRNQHHSRKPKHHLHFRI
ncbi:hypothetical protein HYV86_07135 [Candidatus Woesearchaeota archaeon]|nr:hypothetical protein [Candidatus Woesearchaeota archaeon]